MPRGVYDRSKLKKNKTEAAPTAAKAPKGKPGRKPGSTKVASAQTSSTKVSGNELELFATVRANLDTLNAVAVKFGDIPAVKTEISAHVDLITNLRQKVFGTGDAQSEPKTSDQANGASTQTQQYATSVPMPPAPIPSIPATH